MKRTGLLRFFGAALSFPALALAGACLALPPEVPAEERGREERSPEAAGLSPDERAYLDALGDILICVDPDWEPYERITPQGDFEGIAADLIDLMAGRMGLSFRLVPTASWKESLTAVREGRAHLLAFLNSSPEREEWLTFTEPYFIDPNVFITREDHDFIFDPARLEGETIVFPAGTSLEERFRREYPDIPITTTESEREALRMVVERKADMTLRSLTVAAYTIRKEGLFNLKIAGQAPSFTNHFRMGVRKDMPELRDILNKGIGTISPRDVQDVINRHIAIEVRTEIDYRTLLPILAAVLLFVLSAFFWNLRLRRVNGKLERSTEHLRLIIDTVPLYIFAKDEAGRFIMANRATADFYGLSTDEIAGRTEEECGVEPDIAEKFRDEDRQVLAGGKPLEILDVQAPRKDGSMGWYHTVKLPFRHGGHGGTGVLGVSEDVTERRRIDEKLRHMAQHDGLTKLPNRALFSDRLEQALALAERTGSGLALFFLDLNGFKPVNDRYGHAVGDAVLAETARRLQETVRASDCAGRIGGDEFVLFIRDVKGPDDIREVEDKLRRKLAEPFEHDGLTLALSAAIGRAVFPGDGKTETELLRAADAAMYADKAHSRRR